MAILKRVFLICLLSPGLVSSVSAQDRIHIWVKAFIPNSHPGNPGYVKPVPAQPGKWIISAPVGSDCYMTDNRTFSGDPNASARMTTEFTFTVGNGSATAGPAGPKPIFATGPTHDVNCATGADLLPPRTAATDDMHMGHAAFADGIGQVVIDCRAGNPFFVFLPDTPISFPYAPDIRYGGTFTYDTTKETLRFQGSTGVFPAFEAYAQLNDGPVQTLFRLDPGPGTTVISLTAAGTGLNQQPVDVTITLGTPKSITGNWKGTTTLAACNYTCSLPVTGSFPTNTSGSLVVSYVVGSTNYQLQELTVSSDGKISGKTADGFVFKATLSADSKSMTGDLIASNGTDNRISLTKQ